MTIFLIFLSMLLISIFIISLTLIVSINVIFISLSTFIPLTKSLTGVLSTVILDISVIFSTLPKQS